MLRGMSTLRPLLKVKKVNCYIAVLKSKATFLTPFAEAKYSMKINMALQDETRIMQEKSIFLPQRPIKPQAFPCWWKYGEESQDERLELLQRHASTTRSSTRHITLFLLKAVVKYFPLVEGNK